MLQDYVLTGKQLKKKKAFENVSQKIMGLLFCKKCFPCSIVHQTVSYCEKED